MADDKGIRVAIRVRPMNTREKGQATAKAWKCEDKSIQAIREKGVPAPTFAFDHVFGEASTTDDVYESIGKDIVQAAMDGVNGTIFAYGQTSSGKTHTMMGNPTTPGMIPRAVDEVFEAIAGAENREFLLRVSFMEIYNENITDLLQPTNNGLKIHETPTGELYVGDLTEEVVGSAENVMQLLQEAMSNRRTGSTKMNEESSRSHSIFRIVIESREMSEDGEEREPRVEEEFDGAVRVAQLNLVDLAGSERAAHTGAAGQRLKEGAHINKSLLTLGSVISKLSEGVTAANGHIPYRDSKLTRILQTSLGGNAQTAMICTVTPASVHSDETLSTLKFASRAKKIQNNAVVNEIYTDAALLKKLQKEINVLKQRNQELEAGVGVTQLESEKATLEAELRRQKGEVGQKDQQLDRLTTLILKAGVASPAAAARGQTATDRRLTWAPGALKSARKNRMSLAVGADGLFADITTDRDVARRGSLGFAGEARQGTLKRPAASPLLMRQASRLAKGESGLAIPASGLMQDAQIASLEKTVSEQQQQLEELQFMLEASNKNLEQSLEADIQLAEEKEHSAQLSAEVERLKEAAQQAELQSVQLTARTEEVAKLRADATFMNEELAVLHSAVAEAEGTSSPKDVELATGPLLDEISALKAKAAETEAQHKDLVSYLEETVLKLQSKGRAGELEKEKADLEQHLAEANDTLAAVTAEVNRLRESESASAAEASRLAAEVAAARQELSAEQEALAVAKTAAEGACSEHQRLEEEISSMLEGLIKADDALQAANCKAQDQTDRAQSLQVQLEERDSTLATLKAELAAATEATKAAEGVHMSVLVAETMQARVAELEKQLEMEGASHEGVVSSLRQTVMDLTQREAELSAQLDTLKEELATKPHEEATDPSTSSENATSEEFAMPATPSRKSRGRIATMVAKSPLAKPFRKKARRKLGQKSDISSPFTEQDETCVSRVDKLVTPSKRQPDFSPEGEGHEACAERIAQLQKEYAELKQTLASVEQERNESKESIKSTRLELQEGRLNLSSVESTLIATSAANERLEQTIADCRAKETKLLEHMKTVIERAAEDTESHKTTVADLEVQLAAAQQLQQEMEAEKAEKEMKTQNESVADGAVAEARAAQISSLEGQLASVNELVEKLKDDLEEQFENTMDAKMEADVAARKAALLEKELAALRSDPAPTAVVESSKELEEGLAEAESKIASLHDEKELLAQDLKAMRFASIQFDQQATGLREEVLAARHAGNIAEEQYRTQALELEGLLASSQEEAQKQLSVAEEKTTEATHLAEQLESAQTSLQDATEALAARETELGAMAAHKAEVEARLQQALEEVSRLELAAVVAETSEDIKSAAADEYSGKIAILEEALTEMKDRLNEAEGRRDEAADELTVLQEAYSTLEAAHTASNEGLAAAQQLAESAEERALKLETELEEQEMEAREEGDKIKAELTAALETSREAQTEAEALRAQLEAAVGTSREAEMGADALRAKMETALAASREAETEADALRTKLETALAASREAETEANALRAEMETALAASREAEASAHALSAELETVRAEASNMAAEAGSLKEQLSSGREQITHLQTAAKEVQQQQLEQLIAAEEKIQSLSEAKASVEQTLAKGEKEAARLRAKLEAYQGEMDGIDDCKEQEIEELRSIIDEQEVEMKSAVEAASAKLKEAQESARNQLTETAARETKAMEYIQKLRGQLVEQEASLVAERRSREAAEVSVDAATAQLAAELAPLQEKLAALTKEVRVQNLTITNLRSALEQSKADNASIMASADKASTGSGAATFGRARVDSGTVDNGIQYALKAEIKQLKRRIATLQGEKAEALSSNASAIASAVASANASATAIANDSVSTSAVLDSSVRVADALQLSTMSAMNTPAPISPARAERARRIQRMPLNTLNGPAATRKKLEEKEVSASSAGSAPAGTGASEVRCTLTVPPQTPSASLKDHGSWEEASRPTKPAGPVEGKRNSGREAKPSAGPVASDGSPEECAVQ